MKVDITAHVGMTMAMRRHRERLQQGPRRPRVASWAPMPRSLFMTSCEAPERPQQVYSERIVMGDDGSKLCITHMHERDMSVVPLMHLGSVTYIGERARATVRRCGKIGGRPSGSIRFGLRPGCRDRPACWGGTGAKAFASAA